MPLINFGDWSPDIPDIPSNVAECPLLARKAKLKAFGLDIDNHPGYSMGHDPLEPVDPGRYLLAAVVQQKLNFRWQSEGFLEEDIELFIYRRGSDLPIHRCSVKATADTFAWDGILSGTVLTQEDQNLLPDKWLTVEAGPYMARICAGKLPPVRTYFDLAPLVVIGAGAAGISAVQVLLNDGSQRQVRLLEARDRCGGRAHTVNFAGSSEPIDLGCQWLHNAQTNPLIDVDEDESEHIQTSVNLIKGEVINAQDSEILVEYALEDPESWQAVLAVLKKAPPDEAEKDSEKGEIKKDESEGDDIEKNIKERIREQVGGEVSLMAEAGALRFKIEQLRSLEERATTLESLEDRELLTVVFDRLNRTKHFTTLDSGKKILNPGALAIAREVFFATDAWKANESFCSDLLLEWKKQRFNGIESAYRKESQSLRHKALVSSDQMVLERNKRARSNPHLALALGMECELEESIEASKFIRPDVQDANNPKVIEFMPNEDIGEQYEDTNYMPKEGYGTRIVKKAESMEASHERQLKIYLGHEVTKIEVPDKKPYVMLEVTADKVKTQMLALASVVSVPTPIIAKEKIKFEPRLTEELMSAFVKLPLGHYKKIVFRVGEGKLSDHLDGLTTQFTKSSPENDELARLRQRIDELEAKLGVKDSSMDPSSDQDEQSEAPSSVSDATPPIHDLSIITLDQNDVPWKFLYRHGCKVLVAFCGGELAETLDHGADEVAVKEAKAALCNALGSDWLDAIEQGTQGEVLTSHWSKEPYSLGAYSYTALDGAGSRELLYKTCVRNRLVFAGEALWPKPYGTAHGAWCSGIRAGHLLLEHKDSWANGVG